MTNGYVNRLRRSLTLQQPSGSWTNGFTYDLARRLTNVSSPAGVFSYNYDASWNLHYRTNNGSVQTFLVDTRNQLTNAAGNVGTYDGNGNLVSADNGHAGFVYDAENQLVKYFHCQYNSGSPTNGDVWVRFHYDGKLRLRKRVEYTAVCGGGVYEERAMQAGPELDSAEPTPDQCEWGWGWASETRYIYDGNLVIQERDANNLPAVTYTRGKDLSGSLDGAGGIGGLLARTDNSLLLASGSTPHAYYHAYGNGNVTCLVGTNQLVVARYLYDSYGNTLSASGPLAEVNLYRFSSKEWPANSGLVYYLYRHYDGSLQRWLNRDPLGDAYGVLDAHEGRRTPRVAPWEKYEGPNLFQFAGNNTLGFIDSDGRGKLNVPPGQRDEGWVSNCMLACDNIICKNAPNPSECLKACYNDCMDLKIPDLKCILKVKPKGAKPKITPK